jgi:hypothetical protein
MEPLIIKPTDSTPSITLDKATGIFEIKGNSLPEDVTSFYQPVLNWVKSYVAGPNQTTIFTFKLTYLNTASSKIVFSILSLLEPLVDKGIGIKIDWYYIENDEDTCDIGKEYADLVKIPFSFTSVSNL